MLGWPYCCCQGCVVLTDKWDRADDTNLGGAGWDENAGNWSIASGKLTVGSTNARMGNSGTISFADEQLKLEGKLRSSGDGDKLRLHLTSTRYVELKVGTGATLTWSETGIASNVTAAAGTEHTIVIKCCKTCNTTNSIAVVYLNGTAIQWKAVTPALSGYTDVGYGTGNVLGGTPQFGTIKLEKFNVTDCPDCDRKFPQVQIIISGASNGGGCTSCADYNKTFTLDPDASPTNPSAGACAGSIPAVSCQAWELAVGASDACGELTTLTARYGNGSQFDLMVLDSAGKLGRAWRNSFLTQGEFSTQHTLTALSFFDYPAGCRNGTFACFDPTSVKVKFIAPAA